MIIALTVAFDEGNFAVHYASAESLAQAQQWCERRKANMAKMGTPCASAVLNTDHVKPISDCGADEPPAA